MVVIPTWLDQVSSVNFTPEKHLLTEIESWAETQGWTVSDGAHLPLELRQRTDVAIEKTAEGKRVRLAVLPKGKTSGGEIRVDSSELRTIELFYKAATRRWQVEVSGVVMEEDLHRRGLPWLFDKLFQQ